MASSTNRSLQAKFIKSRKQAVTHVSDYSFREYVREHANREAIAIAQAHAMEAWADRKELRERLFAHF